MPPTADATTAVPQAMASRLTMPSGSYTEGQTNTAAWLSSWMTWGRGSISGIQCTPSAYPLQLLDQLAEFTADLRGVRGARAQHQLGVRVEGAGGAQQMRDALLAGDAADEEDEGAVRVDADPLQCGRVVVGAVHAGVDAVVDDVHPVRVEGRIAGEDVGAHAVGDGDHGVRGLDRGALGPAGQGVAAAELLGLPGAQRLQRVRGHHMRDAVEQLGEMAGEVGVPGVGVDQFAALQLGGHRQVDGEGAQRVVGAVESGERLVAQDAFGRALAPAVHLEIGQRPSTPGPGTPHGPRRPRRRPADTRA